MRTRLTVIVVAILLVAAFAALNWSEFVRPTELLFGPVAMDAPLGLIMLSLLGLALVAFLVSDSITSTRSLMETRRYHTTLEKQRDLADKAEASRFTELRTHLDTQLRELRQRDAITATEFEKAMVGSQRELRTQLEQMNRTMAARLSELEHRLDARFSGMPGFTPTASPARPVMPPQADAMRRDHAETMAREAQIRESRERDLRVEEARLRAERVREDGLVNEERLVNEARRDERAVAADRPPEQSGWRRWF
jgi:uncharacterized integral membrane protein